MPTALSLRRRRQPTKLEQARNVLTAVAAVRLLGARRIAAAAGAAVLGATILAAAKRRSGGQEPVPGAPATPPATPVAPQNGMTMDATHEARAAAASITPVDG